MEEKKEEKPESRKMKAWQINSFGKELTSTLELNCEAPVPEIKKANEVLIKIKAATINPIDVYMVRGYGAKAIQIMREKAKGRGMGSIMFNRGQEFPITLGRDFAGIVEQVGSGVTKFKAGDAVYGFADSTVPGSHAEYLVVSEDWIQLKPDFLNFVEAASIPFVVMTTWCAMRNAGNFTDFTDKNFLVLGGSGGVGTIAIQYLKAKGAKVTTTCSGSACPNMLELGADFAVDYKDPEMEKLVASHGPYDCIYDLAGGLENSRHMLHHGRRGSVFVTLNFSGVHNLDNHGLFLGALKTGWDLLGDNVSSCVRNGVKVKWGVFKADGPGWKEVSELVSQRKIKPVVEQVYKFSEFPQAYERMDKGHLRGKIVVEVNQE